MSNLLANWWRSRRFSAAVKNGNIQLAQDLLEKTHRVGARLSLLQKVFRDKLQSEQTLNQYEREVIVLREQISQASPTIKELLKNQQQLEQTIADIRSLLRYKEQEIVSTQQQLETQRQEIQSLQKQLNQKNQEFASIQQQLEINIKETDLIQQQLVAQGEEIQALHEQLNLKQQEIISMQQQQAASKREYESIQQQLQAQREETQALHNQLRQKEQEFVSTQQQIQVNEQEIQILRNQLNQAPALLFENILLSPHHKFIEVVEEKFKLEEISKNLIQCTSFDQELFYKLENNLVDYLKYEFERYEVKEKIGEDLIKAYCQDIETLKQGKDPKYNSYLSPHIYFIIFFIEGVYSAYLAWFLVYKSGLLPAKSNILDIGAGSGAMLYGIDLFLKSALQFFNLPQIHTSYCSLELQSLLQQHGLEFWKRYIENEQNNIFNTYFRFKNIDLFTYGSNSSGNKELPNNFFDFIVISHCIFADQTQRTKCHQVYKKIFTDSLKTNGYVLVVVQGRRLFQAYGRYQSENQSQEERLIRDFLEEVGLQLEWYKYLTSTGQRKPAENFKIIAKNKGIPIRANMNKLICSYNELRCNYIYKKHEYYTLDDYVILAKK